MAAQHFEYDGKTYRRDAVESFTHVPVKVDSTWDVTIKFISGTTLTCSFALLGTALKAVRGLQNEHEIIVLDDL